MLVVETRFLTSDLWILPSQCLLLRRGDLYSFKVHLKEKKKKKCVRLMMESRWEHLSCLYTLNLHISPESHLGEYPIAPEFKRRSSTVHKRILYLTTWCVCVRLKLCHTCARDRRRLVRQNGFTLDFRVHLYSLLLLFHPGAEFEIRCCDEGWGLCGGCVAESGLT